MRRCFLCIFLKYRGNSSFYCIKNIQIFNKYIAGYKDLALYKLGIPSLTIEVGGEAPDNPVPHSYFSDIWRKNIEVVPAMLYNLKMGAVD